jgi:hypothetical protein
MIKKLLYTFLLLSLILAVLFFLIHSYFANSTFILKLYSIYLFHFIVNSLVYVVISYISKTYFDRIGFAFMTLSVLKMLASVIFLMPIFISDKVNLIPEVINFFAPYFIFLLLEIVFTIKVLQLSHK